MSKILLPYFSLRHNAIKIFFFLVPPSILKFVECTFFPCLNNNIIFPFLALKVPWNYIATFQLSLCLSARNIIHKSIHSHKIRWQKIWKELLKRCGGLKCHCTSPTKYPKLMNVIKIICSIKIPKVGFLMKHKEKVKFTQVYVIIQSTH